MDRRMKSLSIIVLLFADVKMDVLVAIKGWLLLRVLFSAPVENARVRGPMDKALENRFANCNWWQHRDAAEAAMLFDMLFFIRVVDVPCNLRVVVWTGVRSVCWCVGTD